MSDQAIFHTPYTFGIPYISCPVSKVRDVLYESLIEIDVIAILPTEAIWLMVDRIVADLGGRSQT